MTTRQRSLLFVPGNKPEMIAKTPRSAPDVVIIDLEDSVSADQKPQARQTARKAAIQLASAHPDIAVMIRINAASTPYMRADIEEALSPTLAGVVLPKLESLKEVGLLRQLLAKQNLANLRVLVGIESAAGVASCENTLDDNMLGAYFGAEDYIADLGGIRTQSNDEVLFARSRVALACRLAGIPAIDQIVTVLDDSERFSADAAQARNLGYRGKMCIHPAQVPLANAAFTPTPAEVERARRLLAAYEAGVAHGSAAISFEGEMIDEPLARQARIVISGAN